jgi:hypothetical protein
MRKAATVPIYCFNAQYLIEVFFCFVFKSAKYTNTLFRQKTVFIKPLTGILKSPSTMSF